MSDFSMPPGDDIEAEMRRMFEGPEFRSSAQGIRGVRDVAPQPIRSPESAPDLRLQNPRYGELLAMFPESSYQTASQYFNDKRFSSYNSDQKDYLMTAFSLSEFDREKFLRLCNPIRPSVSMELMQWVGHAAGDPSATSSTRLSIMYAAKKLDPGRFNKKNDLDWESNDPRWDSIIESIAITPGFVDDYVEQYAKATFLNYDAVVSRTSISEQDWKTIKERIENFPGIRKACAAAAAQKITPAGYGEIVFSGQDWQDAKTQFEKKLYLAKTATKPAEGLSILLDFMLHAQKLKELKIQEPQRKK